MQSRAREEVIKIKSSDVTLHCAGLTHDNQRCSVLRPSDFVQVILQMFYDKFYVLLTHAQVNINSYLNTSSKRLHGVLSSRLHNDGNGAKSD